jgi:hypothetical protein
VTVCATIDRGMTCAASKRLRKRGALCPLRAPVGEVCVVWMSSQERREMERERRASRQRVASLLAMAGVLAR